MKVTPKSEKEIIEMNLWHAGEYSFEILDASDEVSKVKPDGTGGNEMIKLTVAVYNDSGKHRVIFDYLLDIESMAYKLRHAADACAILDKYEAGTIMADDFKGKSGHLMLAIQKDKNGAHPDKNVIRDYVAGKRMDIDPQAPLHTSQKRNEFQGDPLPWEQ